MSWGWIVTVMNLEMWAGDERYNGNKIKSRKIREVTLRMIERKEAYFNTFQGLLEKIRGKLCSH